MLHGVKDVRDMWILKLFMSQSGFCNFLCYVFCVDVNGAKKPFKISVAHL